MTQRFKNLAVEAPDALALVESDLARGAFGLDAVAYDLLASDA